MTLRYFRLQVDALRETTSTVQLSEIEFTKSNGTVFSWPSGTSVTASISAVSTSESVGKIIDGSVSTKFCSIKYVSGFTITIDLGAGNSLDISTYNKWRWYTANDSPERDPVTFTLSGSSDGSEWTELDSVKNASITDNRNALAYTGTMSGGEPPDPMAPHDGHNTNIGNVAYEIEGTTVLIGGVVNEIASGTVLTGGVQKNIDFSKGVPLTTYSEGDVVYLTEDQALVPFYVAKHNYVSGNTLLVRKDCHSSRQWDGDAVNAYATSDIDAWLNGTYKNLLGAEVQNALQSSSIKYTAGNGSDSVTNLSRQIFLLSLAEYGNTGGNANAEGSALPIASSIKVGRVNGSTVGQWTRTPTKRTSQQVYYLGTSGNSSYAYCATSYGIRPALTVRGTTMFDQKTSAIIA